MLGVVPSTFVGVSILIFGAGFFAGFYIIPLQALLQKLSPDDERGRFLGTTNAMSFTFLSIASVIYSALKPLPVFVDDPQRIFLVSAGLMILGAVNEQDYPIIKAVTVLVAAIFILANILTDILYAFVDPRVRLQ